MDLPIEANQNSVSRGCYSGISRHVKTPRIGGAAIWHDNPIRVRKLKTMVNPGQL